MYTNEIIKKRKRKYFNNDLNFDTWEEVEPYLNEFLNKKINSKEDLEDFILKLSEFKTILAEIFAWKYINMTRFANEEKFSKDYNEYFSNIYSKIQPYDFKIKKLIFQNKYFKDLDKDFDNYKRILENEIKLFKEENIPLSIKENQLTTKYNEIISNMTVNFDNEEKTVTQMNSFLYNNNRIIREDAWRITSERYLKDKDDLNKLFDELKELRIKIANNVGYNNYRDYMHDKKNRFDYTPDDVFEFHNSVEKVIVPFIKEINIKKADELNYDSLKPWDEYISPDNKILKPFNSIEEFVNKGIKILYKVKPEYGINLEKMKNSELLDLENRKGKGPGGYNYMLQETGAPFIFMNAVGVDKDVRTLLHESGHAMHSFSTKDLPMYQKGTPHELAEVASMSMELFTLENLNEYYNDIEDFKKAKKDQLIGTLKIFPWVMIIDAFQQWIYTHPDHNFKERADFFGSLMDRFNTGIDWNGLEIYKKYLWLKQLHVFRVPFYYIEYAISQLGALSFYMNYKKDSNNTLKDYQNFLDSGYKHSVVKTYELGGIKFDFSKEHISKLVNFIKAELESL